jgi:p-aminobenzoyl-glutamate transporter AbgT
MYETERMLLAEIPFIPMYSYVTKRLVDPRLRGWQNNVMDHHYSKNMFLLKLASVAATEPVSPTVTEDSTTANDDGDTEDPVE